MKFTEWIFPSYLMDEKLMLGEKKLNVQVTGKLELKPSYFGHESSTLSITL